METIYFLLHSLKTFVHNDLLYLILLMVSVIVISVLVAKILSLAVRKILSPVFHKVFSDHSFPFIRILEKISFRLVLVLGGYFSLIIFRNGFAYVSEETHHRLIEDYPHLQTVAVVIEGVLFVILIAVLLFISYKFTEWMLSWYAGKINAGENKDLSGSLFPLTQKLMKIGLTALALIIILAKFHIDISGFLVSLGVGSLAIALAAQETISNMISGFIIMSDRPFRIGDRIRIGAEISGDVVAIGIRSTKILDFDNNLLIVPNNDIVKSRIINFTYPDNSTRCLVDIPLPFTASVDTARECFLLSLKELQEFQLTPARECYLQAITSEAVHFRCVFFVQEYKDSFAATIKLREVLHRMLLENGITAPYQQRIVTITNDSKG